ncbi:MAG TPA: L,D-transpeptidase family protein, partial [Allosphingosinicella sp.]|nr:L,D-transpeptidase family protein [Allosphingosinicella sp.]
HYERLLMINLERTRRLPGVNERGRYILVDAGAARLYLFEDGRVRDTMKVIVGKAETATPMMAALMRYASVNPYWNVPPELVQSLIAPRVLSGGVSYLKDRRYEVLSDWTDDASLVDPASVDWRAVADGSAEVRVRQRPGAGNSMGDIKFMMPNEFGIYLHDTPDKSLFDKQDRWISNGCVRVEDARRLAKWLFGDAPKGKDPGLETRVDLDSPVPVYITYMTAGPSPTGVAFRNDPYGRDEALLAGQFGASDEAAAILD